jgi:hypothetical protein
MLRSADGQEMRGKCLRDLGRYLYFSRGTLNISQDLRIFGLVLPGKMAVVLLIVAYWIPRSGVVLQSPKITTMAALYLAVVDGSY